MTSQEVYDQLTKLQVATEAPGFVGLIGQTYLDQAQEAMQQARILIKMAELEPKE